MPTVLGVYSDQFIRLVHFKFEWAGVVVTSDLYSQLYCLFVLYGCVILQVCVAECLF